MVLSLLNISHTHISYFNSYLKKNDSWMHAKAKAVMKKCYEKNKVRHLDYQSLTTIMKMKDRLQETVGEDYWKKATQHLNRFLKRRRENTDLLVKEGLMR